MNNYKIIDMDNWKRKQHCELFRKSALPQYCICFNLDITNFYKAVKKWLVFYFCYDLYSF